MGRSPWTARDALVPLPEAEAGASARARAPAPRSAANCIDLSQADSHPLLFEALSSVWSKRSLAALATRVGMQDERAPDNSPARVLVADGNVVNRKAAVRMLESLGMRADVSANGREAVEMLRLLPYDLVLMDCQVPFMNGQEAAIEIRKREPAGGRHTPIIAMTAETGADCLDGCLASGMDDILRKPIRREDLTATLHRWLPADREKQLQVGRVAALTEAGMKTID